eukprot:TRINITY_DN9808_c0_g1_i1.p1 TRINITY_DN9808_c0_g1~~TRINITY_DN9808_c0_g1_i1.p1  ORF type:complete len:527 (-),score=200.75 TRINITY_DN9808_c0_g1_i1:373-1953(-)
MLVLIAVSLLVGTASAVSVGTVFYDGRSYSFQYGTYNTSGAAFGSFDNALNVSGWGVLKVQSNNTYPDIVQMFAAGFLEGALTAGRISENYDNMYSLFFSSSKPPQNLLDFLTTQDAWVRKNIATNNSALWQQVGFVMAQFDGLVQGYNDNVPTNKQLPLFAFQLLQDVGDFLDLIDALDPSARINWDALPPNEVFRTFAMKGHCSALVKLAPDLSDLWAGQSAWFTYGAMNRIYKHYYLDLNAPFVATKKMSFSSYPGFLVSLDDFYIMDSGLTMIQTTNSILNDKLYKLVVPQNLFAWQRVRAANSMASTGQEWSKILAMYNSGTYNNQYMVVDYKRFVKGLGVQDGTLWVVEQIPGLVEAADVTNQLERAYWPSYNIPYFERIYNMSGYPAFVEKHGPEYSYQACPRAQIFRRDAGTAVDLPSFKAIMRYNDYKNDPISNGDPGKAICSRFDLANPPYAGGCYDSKVTSFEYQSSMISEAINGPTTVYNLPPFVWTPVFNGTVHDGEPVEFNFSFVTMDPAWS